MIASKNIFYRITDENENAVTDVLANLMKYRLIRDVILRFFIPDVSKSALDSISEESIIIQKRSEYGGQPDLQVKSPMIYLIIENKIHNSTSPTDYEKTSYISAVGESEAEYKRLAYLVPNDYALFNDTVESNKDIAGIYHWEDFLDTLQKTGAGELSKYVSDAIEYFSSLVDTHITEDIKLTPMEVAMIYEPDTIFNAISAVEKLKKRFDNIAGQVTAAIKPLFSNDIIITEGESQSNYWAIGRYIILQHGNRKNQIFYGYSNLGDRVKNNEYSLSVAFYIDNDLFDISKFDDKEKDQEWWYIPIRDKKLLVSGSDTDLVNAIADIIRTAHEAKA